MMFALILFAASSLLPQDSRVYFNIDCGECIFDSGEIISVTAELRNNTGDFICLERFSSPMVMDVSEDQMINYRLIPSVEFFLLNENDGNQIFLNIEIETDHRKMEKSTNVTVNPFDSKKVNLKILFSDQIPKGNYLGYFMYYQDESMLSEFKLNDCDHLDGILKSQRFSFTIK